MKDVGNRFDLIVRAGRVVCPANGIDEPGAVAVSEDRITAVGPDVGGTAREVLDFPDSLLLPGLVDLHAHPAREGSKYGVDPDVAMLPRGVTTVLSQGDAGANNWPGYRDSTIRDSKTRVRLAINISARGESMPGGCCEDLDDVDVEPCVRAIEDGGELIWGIAVNASTNACGNTDPREVVRRAVEVAQRTQRPLLFGPRRPEDWPLQEQLQLLRPGDVVTYFFRKRPYSLVKDGRVLPSVRAARQRGVLFDAAYGMTSFDFSVAEAALADEFAPDTISTDRYARHDGMVPPHDLPRTMSKLLAAGMSEADVFAAVTVRPARILGLENEIGTLTPGACADLTVLRWNETAPKLVDVDGVQRPGGCWEPILTVRGGEVVRRESG